MTMTAREWLMILTLVVSPAAMSVTSNDVDLPARVAAFEASLARDYAAGRSFPQDIRELVIPDDPDVDDERPSIIRADFVGPPDEDVLDEITASFPMLWVFESPHACLGTEVPVDDRGNLLPHWRERLAYVIAGRFGGEPCADIGDSGPLNVLDPATSDDLAITMGFAAVERLVMLARAGWPGTDFEAMSPPPPLAASRDAVSVPRVVVSAFTERDMSCLRESRALGVSRINIEDSAPRIISPASANETPPDADAVPRVSIDLTLCNGDGEVAVVLDDAVSGGFRLERIEHLVGGCITLIREPAGGETVEIIVP